MYSLVSPRLYRFLRRKPPVYTTPPVDSPSLRLSSPSLSPIPTNQGPSSSDNSIAATIAESLQAEKNRSSKETSDGLQPILTEEAAGGKIPPWGFSLRLVTGGYLAGDGCSRCPWLARCQGCLVPRNRTVVRVVRAYEFFYTSFSAPKHPLLKAPPPLP